MASTLTELLSTFTSSASTSMAQGGVDPFSLLSNVYDTIEIRSNAAPPMTLQIRELGGAPSPYTRALQPTLIFSGPAGRYVYAPYGEANTMTGTAVSVGMFVGLAGLGFLLGRLTK